MKQHELYPAQRLPGSPEAGGGLLGIVAVVGVILILVQGGIFYRAKTSDKFLGSERNKILSMQMAEAGVEENIADLGSRKVEPTAGMTDFVTYDRKALGLGTYTSKITMVGPGAAADTVDLSSVGSVASGEQAINARLRLRKFQDTTRTILAFVPPESTWTYSTSVRPETTTTTTNPQDPLTMPALNTTPAYTACMASAATKCNVCHLGGGNVANAMVLNLAKTLLNTHISHKGDYVTTDGTCDIYQPKTIQTITNVSRTDSVLTSVVDNSTYDTTINTGVKVQILSWR